MTCRWGKEQLGLGTRATQGEFGEEEREQLATLLQPLLKRIRLETIPTAILERRVEFLGLLSPKQLLEVKTCILLRSRFAGLDPITNAQICRYKKAFHSKASLYYLSMMSKEAYLFDVGMTRKILEPQSLPYCFMPGDGNAQKRSGRAAVAHHSKVLIPCRCTRLKQNWLCQSAPKHTCGPSGIPTASRLQSSFWTQLLCISLPAEATVPSGANYA